MDTKHTPGPWKAIWIMGHRAIVSGEDVVVRTAGFEETKHQEANARLIAAAPELLTAALAALDILEGLIASDCDICGGEGGWTSDCVMDAKPTPVEHKADCPYLAVKAAIAKAEGR